MSEKGRLSFVVTLLCVSAMVEQRYTRTIPWKPWNRNQQHTTALQGLLKLFFCFERKELIFLYFHPFTNIQVLSRIMWSMYSEHFFFSFCLICGIAWRVFPAPSQFFCVLFVLWIDWKCPQFFLQCWAMKSHGCHVEEVKSWSCKAKSLGLEGVLEIFFLHWYDFPEL